MESDLRRKRITALLLVLSVWIGVSVGVSADPTKDVVGPNMSLAQLRETVSGSEWAALTFRLQGIVCASNDRLGLVVLDDGTFTDLLELPSLPPGLRPGDAVMIKATNCLVSRGPFAIQLGTAPLVDIDGNHAKLSASGSVFLREGLHPLRVEWFNGNAGATLNLEYQGEGVPRQKVPVKSLWHGNGVQGELKPGLEYKSYEVDGMLMLPDFSLLEPRARGVVPDPDVGVRSRREMVALVFAGFLQVPKTGRYTFHMTSDDGARLFVADAAVTCDIEPEGKTRSFTPESLASALDAGTVSRWVTFEGSVNFAAKVGDCLELDVTGNSRTFHVIVADDTGLDPVALLHKRVRVVGLKRDLGLVALDKAQLQILSDGQGKEKVLSQVVEIRQLQRDEAAQPYRVEIQGVVTMVTDRSLVLQDATGGVFIHHRSPKPGNSPHPMELWKIEGRTGPGDFAPVIHATRATCIGSAPLPMAVQPTQQQLASGSLDAEMVEIEGVVIEVSNSEIKLLTRGGKAIIKDDTWLYPLPTTGMSAQERASLAGRVVKLRGVYRAIWDTQTGSVQSAVLMLGNASMSASEPASGAPFSEPLTRASDLLLFTSHPSALRRVRIKGQLLYTKPPELFLFDGTSGFRGIAGQEQKLLPGDEVEVSGFPQLGGPSPELLDARARKVGHSTLPVAAKVPYWNLPDSRLDSTLVEIEATLLSDTVRQEERSLEMRAGSNRFVATIRSDRSVPQSIELDSVLRLTGVYISATADRASANSDPFEMRLSDPGNIVIVKHGPWWTKRHTIAVISLLSIGLILAASWVTLLRRTVTRRTNELAVEIEEREMIERHRAMEKERSRMAKDLHDELGSGITVAGLLSSLIKNPEVTEEQKEGYLDQLSDLCCTLVTGLDEIVWAVNPRYDSVADLAGYFSLYAERFLKLAGLECRLTIDEAITKDPLDSRTRHEIFLAFKEALNNIVRHSGAQTVYLTIEVAMGNLKISLADDGSGFDQSVNLPGSDGLLNMQERIRTLGGTCTIESRPEEGTIVQFEISLKRTQI
ncbi:MAG: PA14 domain-containing protein [Verrucomicrobiota bacterium]